MSCNGCRVLRKGCSHTCILRPCLQWIETSQSQGHATVFVAKFFGRAGLMSFISAVPENQRPALFQSLLFEAAGRTVNPVSGAVGLLWTGNWHVCQAAVETVLRGGNLNPIPELDVVSGRNSMFRLRDSSDGSPRPKVPKRRRFLDEPSRVMHWADLDLSLTSGLLGWKGDISPLGDKRRPWSPSMDSEESLTTTCEEEPACEIKLLKLFG